MPVCWKDWTNQQFFSLLSTGGHAGIIVIIVVVVVAIVPQNVMHDPHSDEPPRGQIAQPFQFKLSGFNLVASGSHIKKFFCKVLGQTVATGAQKMASLRLPAPSKAMMTLSTLE
jgi:hypothetical protein